MMWPDEAKRDLFVLDRDQFLSKYPYITKDAYRHQRERLPRADVVMRGLAQNFTQVRREPALHPTGWEPKSEWDGTKGSITAKFSDPDPKWDTLLVEWGFDPEKVMVVEPVQFRTWDAAIGEGETKRFYYYKANVVSRRTPKADIESLIKEISAIEPSPAIRPTGDLALVVSMSDWQIGKKSSKETVQRVIDMIDGVERRVNDLRATGRNVGAIYGLGLGDIVEGCDGQYAMQSFEVELDYRDQVKLARRLVVLAAQRWSAIVDKVVMAAVGGNHGEKRKDGKAFTSFGDNADIEVFEQAAEILGANPVAYPNVSWVIPNNELTITLDIAGTIVGVAHGHQAGGGANAQAKIEKWWQLQGHGRRPVGDAAVLVVGHFHQFVIAQNGYRTMMISPTLDSGSQWFAESYGMESVAGTLTFVVGPNGWSDVQVIR